MIWVFDTLFTLTEKLPISYAVEDDCIPATVIGAVLYAYGNVSVFVWVALFGANSQRTFNIVLPLPKSLKFVNFATVSWGAYGLQIRDLVSNTSSWVSAQDGGSAQATIDDVAGLVFRVNTDTVIGSDSYDYAMYCLVQATITFS